MRRPVRSVRLKYVMARGTFPSGNERLYFRHKGKLTPLPDAPTDAPEFLKAYAELLSTAKASRVGRNHPTGTIGAGVKAYLASDQFLAMRPTTRAVWRRNCEKIEKSYGAGRMKDLKPKHIRIDIAALDPNPANHRLKVWRSLTRFWLECGFIEGNIGREVEGKRAPKSEGHRPWTTDDVEAFRSYWGTHTHQRLAFELMYRTCAAIGDACRLGPGHIKDGWLVYRRNKSDVVAASPMRGDIAPAWFAFNDDLEKCLRHHPRHMTFLATRQGASRSPRAATQWFSKACRDAGVDKTAHGIRKYRAVMFREGGATPDQRMAILGHDTEKMAAHYSKSADLARVISGTKFANRDEPECKLLGK